MDDIIGIVLVLLVFGGPILTVLGWALGIILAIWEFICEMFEGIGDFFDRRKKKKLEKKRQKEQQRREKLRKKHHGFASINDVPREKLLLEEMYKDHVGSDEARATQCAKAAADLGSISCAYHAGRLLLQQGNLDEAERYAKMAEGKYDSTDQLLFRIRRAKLVRDGITAYDVGSWQEANTPDMAYRLNVPVVTACGGNDVGSFVKVEAENVIVEAVKAAEKEDGVVIRVYECFGRRTSGVKLALGFAAEKAEVVNILEDKLADTNVCGGVITFDMKPYEIKTFKIGG